MEPRKPFTVFAVMEENTDTYEAKVSCLYKERTDAAERAMELNARHIEDGFDFYVAEWLVHDGEPKKVMYELIKDVRGLTPTIISFHRTKEDAIDKMKELDIPVDNSKVHYYVEAVTWNGWRTFL